MSPEFRLTHATADCAPLGDSFISPEEMENLSVLMDDTEFPVSGARLKSKSKKTKKVKAESSQPEASSSSVADLIQLELLRKENLATQLKIAETELQLAQLKASSRSPEVAGTTPSISPVKLQSAIEPNASSSPRLPSLPEYPFLNQL